VIVIDFFVYANKITEIRPFTVNEKTFLQIFLTGLNEDVSLLMEQFTLHQKTEGMTSAQLFDLAEQAKIREGENMDK